MDPADVARSLDGYAAVMRQSTGALEEAGVGYLVFGSVAMRALGRPRDIDLDEDFDLFIRPPDAPAALAALEHVGFVAEQHDESWIYKAKRMGVTVDLIFKAAARMYVDDEMLERAVRTPVLGVELPLIPREDFIVMKSLLHGEDRAYDWFDAISLLESDLDWEYLVRRAKANGAQRVLSLLLYADAAGVTVPRTAIVELERTAIGATTGFPQDGHG